VSTFVDASVIVAIVGGERDENEWVAAVGEAPALKSSAIAMWEAVRAVSRLRTIGTDAALADVRAFVDLSRLEIVAIGFEEAVEASLAHDRYGKGNHPAQLNMGDCFAYACAKTNNARLLHKGDDFAKTDLA